MNAVFLTVLACYVAYAVYANRGPKPPQTWRTMIVTTAVQGPAFILACWFAARNGVFSRQLLSPTHAALGLIVGHALFGLSLVAIDCTLREAGSHLVDIRGVWRFAADCPAALRHVLVVSISEELIWRVAAQTMVIGLLSAWMKSAARAQAATAGIVITAFAFSIIHRHFFRNALRESLEFLAFALALGILYYASRSLTLVVAVHALRNFEIAYLEYQIKAEELGDPERALREIELEHSPARHRNDMPISVDNVSARAQ